MMRSNFDRGLLAAGCLNWGVGEPRFMVPSSVVSGVSTGSTVRVTVLMGFGEPR